MITLSVVVDELIAPRRSGVTRYAASLTAALVAGAPAGCDVRGLVAASTESEYDAIRAAAPGLAGLDKSALAGRELRALWSRGLARLPRGGLVHAPSLLAPLVRHDRINDGTQVVATIHDATAWTDPELLPAREASWQRAMGERARRHADAVVVPSHAVADTLSEALGIGDRIRVIAGAPAGLAEVPADADERAARLGLPERMVLAIASTEPRKGLDRLIAAMALPDAPDIALVVAGADRGNVEAMARDAGLPGDRLLALGMLDDDDLATAIGRATVVAVPSRAEGFGLGMLEAMRLGAPIVHSALPALDELAAGAGIAVALEDDADAPAALAAALRRVADDEALADRLGVSAADRATAFTWRGAAEQVWRLHADL